MWPDQSLIISFAWENGLLLGISEYETYVQICLVDSSWLVLFVHVLIYLLDLVKPFIYLHTVAPI